jgi:hypothetical protein
MCVYFRLRYQQTKENHKTYQSECLVTEKDGEHVDDENRLKVLGSEHEGVVFSD